MSPIIDLIIRIKNGYMSGRESIDSPYSSFREAVVKKLQKVGYVKDYTVEGETIKTMTITLIYADGVPAVTDVKVFSKPGRRWYVSTKELKPVLGGMGHAFLSTPKGILTNIEAKKEQVGGELLFHIW
jgi:small subunit ribosomal protein S8